MPTITICFPGAAANVFWQFGAVHFIHQQPWRGSATFRGASAGAISCALAACDVPVRAAIDRAFALAELYGVDLCPFGVVGVFGPIVREWLEDVLPDDCARRCSGRIEVLVRAMASLRIETLTRFTSKSDLIHALLASCHLPFALDLRPFAEFRGKWYVDGQLFVPDERVAKGCRHVLSYRRDPRYVRESSRTGRLRYRTLGDALRGARMGYRFARRELHR